MKTPEKIYVTKFGIESIERNQYATVFIDPSPEESDICYIREDIAFTKEQVIELMKKAWAEAAWSDVSRLTFEEWFEKEKPFDSK